MNNLPTKNCTGCSACLQKCPKQCISMIANEEGFLYPQVDSNQCIHCNLCEKVCPILNKNEYKQPIQIYIGHNLNGKIILQSSSGGIFTLLAERIIEEGGVVFGARFNENWEVIHDYVESSKDLFLLRGSKYVQSNIGKSYLEVQSFLKSGRKVLFSGTPCQIAGLKKFLNVEYENLLTIDFICRGVPSPSVWRRYLQEYTINNELSNNITRSHINNDSKYFISNISFRDKTFGWKNFCLNILPSSNQKKNIITLQDSVNNNSYLQGFIHNLYLRPSCHNCQIKSWSSNSDITLADAWGIWNEHPELDNDKGSSIITILSYKGEKYFKDIHKCGLFITENEDFILKYNPAAYHSAKSHKNRKKFFYLFINSQYTFPEIIHKCLPQPSLMEKIIWSINKRIKKYAKKES